MKLSTPVELNPSEQPIPLGASILALGSCFAERVGERLEHSLFPVCLNPTGIAYNPVSLARLLSPRKQEGRLFLHHSRWRSLAHHSKLSGFTPEEALDRLHQGESERLQALADSEVLLLTLGTAQVFELETSGQVVTNCHRLPQQLFRRRRLSPHEVALALRAPLAEWLRANKNRRLIFTVSPVRYVRQGLIESSRGKAALLLACETLCSQLPRTEYFPSYEIMMDELRGYRFYRADMIQPNEQAVEFIWERFRQSYFPNSLSALNLVEKIQKLAAHRANPSSDQRRLGQKGLELLDRLEAQAPQLRAASLREHFSALL